MHPPAGVTKHITALAAIFPTSLMMPVETLFLSLRLRYFTPERKFVTQGIRDRDSAPLYYLRATNSTTIHSADTP